MGSWLNVFLGSWLVGWLVGIRSFIASRRSRGQRHCPNVVRDGHKKPRARAQLIITRVHDPTTALLLREMFGIVGNCLSTVHRGRGTRCVSCISPVPSSSFWTPSGGRLRFVGCRPSL